MLIVLVGFISTFIGASSGFESLTISGTSDPQLFYGLMVSLLEFLNHSMTVFTLFTIVWYVLRSRHEKLLIRTAEKA